MVSASRNQSEIPAFWGRSQKFEAVHYVRHLAATPPPPTSALHSQSPSPAPSPRGYFAFPPDTPDNVHVGSASVWPHTDTSQAHKSRADAIERERLRAWEERKQMDERIRKVRLDNERATGTDGEVEWVRSGGILRDSNGKRDMKKTEAIRAELALQQAEKQMMARWEAYESKWHALLADDASRTQPIHFADLPWPVHPPTEGILTVADVSAQAIGSFLLESLKVRGNTTTRRERIRAAMLRWHPDKNGALLARVVDEDADAVRTGISVVMTCLQELLSSKE